MNTPVSPEQGGQAALSFFRERKAWLVAVLAALVLLLYCGLAAAGGGTGFPLDDAWIHQTYARNLAQTGRWEYVPGASGNGSTSPLWTVLLTVGYLLPLPYLLWTFLLGWLSLVWVAWAGMALWALIWPKQAEKAWLAGLTLVLSWPLVWAAGSGMETLLFTALALQVMVLYSRQMVGGRWRPALLGLAAGFLVLARPDGLGLLLLAAAGMLLAPDQPAGQTMAGRMGRLGLYLLAAALPLVPAFALNLAGAGRLWPNTFYAKQAEYAVLWEQPIWARFGRLLYFSLGGPESGWRGISGAQLLLLPGLFVSAWSALRSDWERRRLFRLLPLLWAAGHLFLFAWRLPVTYQHGRYLMPVLPVIVLYGLSGWLTLLDLPGRRAAFNPRLDFIWRSTTTLVFFVLLVVFVFLGAQAYSLDTAFINGEMVAVAQWLEKNTPQEALVAAHDIGAIGYFSGRPLLDLAGLVSPEIIPMLDDPAAVELYVRESQADFLVTAPGWPYAGLTGSAGVNLLYTSGYRWTTDQGANNMAVYHLER